MKKIIIAILLCYSSNVIAQTPSPYDSNKVRQPEGMYGKNASNYKFGTIVIPTDTVKMAARDSGAIAYKESKLYLWNGRYWTIPATGSSINIGNSNLTLTGNRVLDCDGEMFQLYHPAPFSIITYSGLVLGVQADSLSMNENIILRKNGQATFRDGTQSDGYVYTCDADGNGSWQPSSGGGSTTLQGAIDNSPLLDKDNTIDGGGFDYTDSNFSVRKFEGDSFRVVASKIEIGTIDNIASGNNSIAIGSFAQASGGISTAIGSDAIASGFNSHSYGSSVAIGNYSISIGDGNTASGVSSSAFGSSNQSLGEMSLTVGGANIASNKHSAAVGFDLVSNRDSLLLLGYNPTNIEIDDSRKTIKTISDSIVFSGSKVFIQQYPDTLTSNFSQIGRDITTGKIGVIAGGGGGSGTVTSVATGYGLSGGTITTSGTLLVDSATLSTKYLRITDTANMRVRLVAGTNITNISGTYPNLTINAATQTTDTTSLSSRINLKANIASPTFTGTPILPTGTIATTQSAGNNSTAIATTAYADAADNTKWSLASGGTLTGTNTITAGTNPFIFSTGVTTGTGATAGHQIVANSLTSGNANDYSSSSLTAGSILKLTSTSTAANAFSLLNINSSGANASSTRKAIGQVISVTNTGTTSTNIGLISNTSGASNNYSILVQNGNVGFGLNPQERLSVMANSRSTYAQRWYDTDSTIVAGIYVGGTGAGTFELYDASGNVGFQLSNTAASYFNGTGGVGINQLTPTARLHIGAGTATANTSPLKLTSGTNLTTAEAGAIEYNGTNIFFTPSSATRNNFLITASVNSVSPTAPDRTITVVINGTTYYIHAKTTND